MQKHPWRPLKQPDSKYSSRTLLEFTNVKPALGTAYAISIQPLQDKVYYNDDVWIRADENCRKNIAMSLNKQKMPFEDKKISFFDLMQENHCIPPAQHLIDPTHNIIILRPPRLTSKQNIGQWLSLFDILDSKNGDKISRYFIICELSPFQSLSFAELIKMIHAPKILLQKLFLYPKSG